MLGRKEAITELLPWVASSAIVHCNGFISRESYSLQDRPEHFYMIGSMGMASSIALGVALAQPDRPVTVFDGDGNLLMNLGTMATIGARQPRNLFHLVFDNGAYASTGYQKTITDRVDLARLAAAAGYRSVHDVKTVEGLREAAAALYASEGPGFLLIRIDPKREDNRFGRIGPAPPEITRRFMDCLKKGGAPSPPSPSDVV